MKHCLVVDDSRVIRKVATTILAGLAYESVEAEDGAQALKACRARMPDLVLLDWNIPGTNTLEFLRGLRREPRGDLPFVLYCTTENDVGRIQEALVCGANDYLLKPYDEQSLRERLSSAGLD
ncbi:MAG: response regulator [Alphaproteobacteria bacterium]|nr:response regulator [Alphaproteobacteria bacterium]